MQHRRMSERFKSLFRGEHEPTNKLESVVATIGSHAGHMKKHNTPPQLPVQSQPSKQQPARKFNSYYADENSRLLKEILELPVTITSQTRVAGDIFEYEGSESDIDEDDETLYGKIDTPSEPLPVPGVQSFIFPTAPPVVAPVPVIDPILQEGAEITSSYNLRESGQYANDSGEYVESMYANDVCEITGSSSNISSSANNDDVEFQSGQYSNDVTEANESTIVDTISHSPIPLSPTPPPDHGARRKLLIDDWNGRFQRCIAAIRKSKGDQTKLKLSFRRLVSLAQDFVHSAKTYGKIIIDEHELPNEQKTVKPLASDCGVLGGQKYIVANIIFKFATRNEKLKNFNDDMAAKVAGHELKGLLAYYNCNISGLNVPLIALIDYRGFRLSAISILPINSETIKYGSNDGGKEVIHNELPEEMHAKLVRAAKIININAHYCTTMSGKKELMVSPCDLEGHIGTDNRFYIIDFSRTLPPVKPSSGIPYSFLFRLFRPEFVQQYKVPLCSDGFSGFIKNHPTSETHNNDLVEATRYLHEKVILETAELLGIKLSEFIRSGGDVHAFPLVRLIHSQGVNMRYLPLLRQFSKTESIRGLLLVEMVARTIKTMLRRSIRQEMKTLKVPVEAPYKEKILNHLNVIFGPPEVVSTSTFWEQLPATMMSKYKDGSIFFPSENQTQIRQYIINCFQGLPNGMVVLSMRIVSFLKIKLGAMLSKLLQNYPLRFNLCDFYPLEEVDIKTLGVRIKHMNLVAHAEGYLLKVKGDSLKDDEAKKVVFAAALEKLEEALLTDSRNKYTLRNCGIVLSQIYRLSSHQAEGSDFAVLRKAQNYFIEALKMDPKDSFSCYQYAKFLYQTATPGDPDNDKRENEFLKMLQNVPSDLLVFGFYYAFLIEAFPDREEDAKKVWERSSKIRQITEEEEKKKANLNQSSQNFLSLSNSGFDASIGTPPPPLAAQRTTSPPCSPATTTVFPSSTTTSTSTSKPTPQYSSLSAGSHQASFPPLTANIAKSNTATQKNIYFNNHHR